MKLQIKNLGAVANGSIDLGKKFNLLCGPNGTGKTYFAYVIYGLLRNMLHVKGDVDLADSLIASRMIDVPIDREKLLKYRDSMRDALVKNLDELFGIGEIDRDNLFPDFALDYKDSPEDFVKQIIVSEMDLTETLNGVKVRMLKLANSDQVHLSIEEEDVPADAIAGLRLMLQTVLYYNLAISPIRSVVMFPVERNSIYTFSKELSIRKQEAMDSIQMLVDKDRKFDKFDILFNSKRYPLPIMDGLMVADDLLERKKYKSEFYEFAEQIENELLHGKVQISNDGDIRFKPSKSSRKLLPIQMTASIIKTLSSLVIYLKHIARKNDLIIIDEPEINLHPDNQIVLTQILTRLANKGFRLLVSTHSDYIVREINNLVMMSHEDNVSIMQIAEEKKYTRDMFIRKEDLGVLFFDYKNKSSKSVEVVSVPVDDAGFEVVSIDKVIESQSVLSERLFYALNYPMDEE